MNAAQGVAPALSQAVAPVAQTARRVIDDIARFAKLERVLATVCAFTPALIWWVDPGPLRGSISAYYNMAENQLFYVPLTMAAMLFVTNGVVKEKALYNTYLGFALAGVLLFNRDDFNTLHHVFAVAFFGGNVAVMLLSKKARSLKLLMAGLIALAMLGFFLFDWFTLFWAEWFSLGVIAVHYVLVSFGKAE